MRETLPLLDWAVSRLLDGFGIDPQAALLGLLTLCYGQPPGVVLQARTADFDLSARLWWCGAAACCLPLTGSVLHLLKLYRQAGLGADEHLFALSMSKAQRRVARLSGGVLPLDTLRAWALAGCPDLESSDQRREILRRYAEEGATVAQVAGLERELDARLLASVTGWHGVLLARLAL